MATSDIQFLFRLDYLRHIFEVLYVSTNSATAFETSVIASK